MVVRPLGPHLAERPDAGGSSTPTPMRGMAPKQETTRQRRQPACRPWDRQTRHRAPHRRNTPRAGPLPCCNRRPPSSGTSCRIWRCSLPEAPANRTSRRNVGPRQAACAAGCNGIRCRRRSPTHVGLVRQPGIAEGRAPGHLGLETPHVPTQLRRGNRRLLRAVAGLLHAHAPHHSPSAANRTQPSLFSYRLHFTNGTKIEKKKAEQPQDESEKSGANFSFSDLIAYLCGPEMGLTN